MKKTGDNTDLFPHAIRSGITGVFDFELTNIPPVVPPRINPMSIPLFASSLLLSGYQKIIALLNSTFTILNTKGFIQQITNNSLGTIDQTGLFNILFTDGAATNAASILCPQINYFDLLEMIIGTEILKITNIRLTIPVGNLPQTKQNIYFFRQSIFGNVELDDVGLASYFNPENKTGINNNQFVIDVPVNYFVSDTIGVAFDVIPSASPIKVSFTCEKYFNHSFTNFKK